MLKNTVKNLIIFLILALVGAGAYIAQQAFFPAEVPLLPPPAPANTIMQKNTNAEGGILMVVAPAGVRDEEYFLPRGIFEQAGIKVTVASIQKGSAKSVQNKEITIDKTVSDIVPEEYRAVVFIGGPGMAEIADDDSLMLLARKFEAAGKITAAICVAPKILARAGILEGRQAVSWEGVRSELEKSGALISSTTVAVDGRLITAVGPAAAAEFGDRIVAAIGKQ